MRKVGSLVMLAFFVAALLAVLPKAAAAQDDPPGRVGRLNYLEGSVSYQVAGDQNWVQADPNRPLTTGDNLWVDNNSRGEVHIGSTAIRLSSQTGVSFLTLDDRTVQLQLAQGTIEVHIRHLSGGDAFEVDSPNLAFTINRAGEYRIQTDPSGASTIITVREGAGEVTGSGDSWDLAAGQQYIFNGTDQLSYDASEAPGFDNFEDWCQSRDQRENNAASARYVSRDIDGYYDLDDYGSWESDSDYGELWVPRGVAAGWVPYQTGHWVYIAPWGWTWVDDEPWGWAPFHYGRWYYVGDHWGWVPGPVVVRPVYAPAVVGFVGGGGFGFSVAFGGGFSGVAWFPLGPRDVFVPGYRTSPRYFQNINITNTRVVNVTQVTSVYNTVVVNRDVTHVNYTYANNERAVTAVSRDTFVNARPVATATLRVNADQIRTARVAESAPIAPGRTSYVSATARVSTARPAVPFAQRPVVARLNPAVPVNRTPQPGNKPAPINQASSRSAAPGTNNTQPQSRDGFRPFQPPASGANNSPQGGNNNRTSFNSNNSPANTRSNGSSNKTQDQPPVKFTPPQKARDDMYDVHPPLNNKQGQAQQPPKQEERKAAPPPKQEKPKDKDHDDKH